MNSMYTVFIRFNKDRFLMAGNQFGFVFDSSDNIYELWAIVEDRLNIYFARYNLTNHDINYVNLTFRVKDKKLLSEFKLDDEVVHFTPKQYMITRNLLSIPASVNKDSLGKALDVQITDGTITHIKLNINNNSINFLDVIKSKAKILRVGHKDNISSFDSNFKFYLLKDNKDFVLAIKIISGKSIQKIRYSLNGIILEHVIDNIVNNLIIRRSGLDETVIEDNKVLSMKQDIKLKSVDKQDSKALSV